MHKSCYRNTFLLYPPCIWLVTVCLYCTQRNQQARHGWAGAARLTWLPVLSWLLRGAVALRQGNPSCAGGQRAIALLKTYWEWTEGEEGLQRDRQNACSLKTCQETRKNNRELGEKRGPTNKYHWFTKREICFRTRGDWTLLVQCRCHWKTPLGRQQSQREKPTTERHRQQGDDTSSQTTVFRFHSEDVFFHVFLVSTV